MKGSRDLCLMESLDATFPITRDHLHETTGNTPAARTSLAHEERAAICVDINISNPAISSALVKPLLEMLKIVVRV